LVLAGSFITMTVGMDGQLLGAVVLGCSASGNAGHKAGPLDLHQGLQNRKL